jgi:ribose 5-phosphate isomerase B
MKIFVGADHNGFELKEKVIDYLKKAGHDVEDAGDEVYNPDDDFPVFAAKVVNKLKASDNKDPRAVLICGSGQGMVIAANRHKGIRAGLGWDVEAAKSLRNDEDSNVLGLPGLLLKNNPDKAFDIIDVWLKTPFANAARFIRRNKELDNL